MYTCKWADQFHFFIGLHTIIVLHAAAARAVAHSPGINTDKEFNDGSKIFIENSFRTFKPSGFASL